MLPGLVCLYPLVPLICTPPHFCWKVLIHGLSPTEPLSLLRPIGCCCITIVILNGLLRFLLKSVDVQHSVSFPFKSHDKRCQKFSLYCGFSTPVLPSASAQSSLAATREMNADWERAECQPVRWKWFPIILQRVFSGSMQLFAWWYTACIWDSTLPYQILLLALLRQQEFLL